MSLIKPGSLFAFATSLRQGGTRKAVHLQNADLLNDQVLPFYEEHGLPVLRIMTDRGTEFCGRPDKHDYQLFLAINDIDHTKTKVNHPQTNGICERFHKTALSEEISLSRAYWRPSFMR